MDQHRRGQAPRPTARTRLNFNPATGSRIRIGFIAGLMLESFLQWCTHIPAVLGVKIGYN